MSGAMKSMPAMSRPTTRAAVSAISMLSGCASCVRSIAVPPVDMLPVAASITRWPLGGTASSSRPCLRTSSSAPAVTAMRVRTFSWPMPRRGSEFSMSTSSRTVCLPSPVTPAGHALSDGGELAADHQHAVVVARNEGLDDHVAVAALVVGRLEGAPDIVLVAQVERDAAAVVAVERLDDAPDSRSRAAASTAPSSERTTRDLGTGSPAELSSELVTLLSEAMSTRDRTGARGHRRADALLVDALAELDEARAAESDPRDVARDGLVDDRLRRRPEGAPLGEADQVLELLGEVERRLVWRDEVVDERHGQTARLAADVLVADTRRRRCSGHARRARCASCRRASRSRRGSAARARRAR